MYSDSATRACVFTMQAPLWYELWLNNMPAHIRAPNRFEAVLFILSLVMWSQGAGIHLSSNSINQTVGKDVNNPAFDVRFTY